MPRKPKDLTRYSTADDAAKGLEDLARDIRERSEAGMLVRWDINMRFWHPDWEEKRTPSVLVTGEKLASAR